MIALILGASMALTPMQYRVQANMELHQISAHMSAVLGKKVEVEPTPYDNYLAKRIDGEQSCLQIKDEFVKEDRALVKKDFEQRPFTQFKIQDAYLVSTMAGNYIQLKCFEKRSQK